MSAKLLVWATAVRAGYALTFGLAQAVTLVNMCFVLAALLCTFGLPRTLGGSGEQPEPEQTAAYISTANSSVQR